MATMPVDAIVFTGGIGENSALIRELICSDLTHIGIKLDTAKNTLQESLIHHQDSHIKLLIIPTNEELQIALHVKEMIFNYTEPSPF